MADHSDGGSETKKRKKDLVTLAEFRIPKSLHSKINQAARSIIDSFFYSLSALKFHYSNAIDGSSFSSAICKVVPDKTNFYSFAVIFKDGLEILDKFLHNEALQNQELECCLKLIQFLTDEDAAGFIERLTQDETPSLVNETQMAVAIVEHLLKKLAIKDSYIVDNRKRIQLKEEETFCDCGCPHKVAEKFKDTSIGNKKVWHGYLDVLLGYGSQEVPVCVPDTEEQSPGGKPPDEVKFRNLNDKGVVDQIIAQTIVFSFLQKKRHPSDRHFLYPCIGISSKNVCFHFYDSELDILLQSINFPLCSSGSLDFSTVIAIWLVVNYKYLGSGLKGKFRDLPKSDFFNLAGKAMKIYKEELNFGRVGSKRNDSDDVHRHLNLVTTHNFVALEDREDLFPIDAETKK